ncbi:MAG: hypothetical protein MUO63_08185 [Desulfobulbaceae bacterium]|nr:hypothetical protein [Desulfobulbaceae bacterium]
MKKLHEVLEEKSPQEALSLIAEEAKSFMIHVSEQDRLDFVMKLIGNAGADNVASMVNL